MSEYKILKYNHNAQNKETNKNSFISFINKNIQYVITVKNMDVFHHYNRNSVETLNNCINQYQWISLIKFEENIETIQIWKT